jgi:hypothetical protein
MTQAWEHFAFRRLGVLICVVLIVGGCIHAPAPYRPEPWEHSPIDLKSVVDRPGNSLLQVIIVYGHWWSHHTALRLLSTDQPVQFWDPGGGYGDDFPEEIRSRDLVRVHPPDLPMYVRYAWNLGGLEVEVFEWDLTPDEARGLYDILVHRTDGHHPAGRFTTATARLFCTVAVSDFLHRFAGNILTVPELFFLPEHLARVLYTQSPRRVLALRPHEQTVYFPETVNAGGARALR